MSALNSDAKKARRGSNLNTWWAEKGICADKLASHDLPEMVQEKERERIMQRASELTDGQLKGLSFQDVLILLVVAYTHRDQFEQCERPSETPTLVLFNRLLTEAQARIDARGGEAQPYTAKQKDLLKILRLQLIDHLEDGRSLMWCPLMRVILSMKSSDGTVPARVDFGTIQHSFTLVVMSGDVWMMRQVWDDLSLEDQVAAAKELFTKQYHFGTPSQDVDDRKGLWWCQIIPSDAWNTFVSLVSRMFEEAPRESREFRELLAHWMTTKVPLHLEWTNPPGPEASTPSVDYTHVLAHGVGAGEHFPGDSVEDLLQLMGTRNFANGLAPHTKLLRKLSPQLPLQFLRVWVRNILKQTGQKGADRLLMPSGPLVRAIIASGHFGGKIFDDEDGKDGKDANLQKILGSVVLPRLADILPMEIGLKLEFQKRYNPPPGSLRVILATQEERISPYLKPLPEAKFTPSGIFLVPMVGMPFELPAHIPGFPIPTAFFGLFRNIHPPCAFEVPFDSMAVKSFVCGETEGQKCFELGDFLGAPAPAVTRQIVGAMDKESKQIIAASSAPSTPTEPGPLRRKRQKCKQ